jgi:limonene-1,2-epoxide hydrolase
MIGHKSQTCAGVGLIAKNICKYFKLLCKSLIDTNEVVDVDLSTAYENKKMKMPNTLRVLSFVFTATLISSCMPPQEQNTATLAAVERFNAALNRHDVDAVMEAMTRDCVFENTAPAPDGRRIEGAAEVRAYWEKFIAANPDAHFDVEEIFAVKDRCVVRWVYRKTKDNLPWHLRGVDIFKIQDGKVAEKLSYVKG